MTDMQEPPPGHPALDEVPSDDTGIQIAVNWRSVLEYSGKSPLCNLDNVVRVLENDPEFVGKIWYDEFVDSIITTWHGDARKWIDVDDTNLQLYMQRSIGLSKVTEQMAHAAVKLAAFRNIKNECKEYLCSRVWDTQQRLNYVMAEAFGADPCTYSSDVGRCWFISMVARVLNPGCKVDTVPVLEGKQGKGKSTALGIIGGKWFTECHESVLTKDFYGVLDGYMLVEISEMHSFKKAEVDRVKGIISCRVDRYRSSYGRNTQDHPRKTVLACTTNRDDWQNDDTGARRFWPILCKDINLEWLENNRDQLFAEAVHLYKLGVCWWDVNTEDQERETNARRDVDSWEPLINDWLTARGRDKVTITEVLKECLQIEIGQHDQRLQKRVGRALRALGWDKGTVRIEGIPTKGWMKQVL